MKPPPHLRERVLADALRRDDLRAWELPVRPLLAVLGTACVARWSIALVQEIGAGGLAHDRSLAWIAVVTATATTALVATGRRGMLGPPLARLVLAVLAGLLVLTVAPFLVHQLAPHGHASSIHEPHGDGAAYAGAALLALAAAPRGEPLPPGVRGGALGAAAGLWISAACSLTCTVTDPWHVVVHHVAFVPVLALAVGLVEHARALAARSYRLRPGRSRHPDE